MNNADTCEIENSETQQFTFIMDKLDGVAKNTSLDKLGDGAEDAYPIPFLASPLLPLLLLSLARQKNAPDTSNTFKKKYDYIVVGAGSAGSVVASRLSEISCVSVLLLEAGKPPPTLTEVPAIGRSFINSDIDWMYHTEPQKHTAAGLIDRRVPWPSGKTLGGTSVLNAMLYLRGNRRNYDEWAKNGAEGWSYNNVLPYFKKLEDNTDPNYVATGYHSTGGPVTVSRPKYNPELKLAEIKAMQEQGYRMVDVNGPEQIGFYDYQSNTRDGQRCSTAKAYLVPAENRTNLDILTHAFVRKVLFKGKKAIGVEFDFNGKTQKVKARKEVILSAGAINSAQLLMLSGIGPKDELDKFDIPVLADLPVGKNLQDHIVNGVYYELNPRLRPYAFDVQLKKPENVKDYMESRKGPLTSSEGVHLMAFLSNPNTSDARVPDYCLYLADYDTITLTQLNYKPEVIAATVVPLADKTLITCSSQLLHPKSRGTVTLRSSDPHDPPVIDPNYLCDEQDVLDMVEGLKTCKRILSSPAMKKLGSKDPGIVLPGCEKYVDNEDEYLKCYTRSVVSTTNHQVGTAKMGNATDPTTVVNPFLRVKGVKRLRVVDASVMPTVPWSNTNIPTIMVAEKASDIIKSSIRCGGNKIKSC